MTFDTFTGYFNQTSSAGDLPYAMALYAQAWHETGNFTSNIYLNHKNLFGMKPSQNREQYYDDVYASPNGETFASYPDVIRSLFDRIDLDDYNRTVKPRTNDDIERYYQVIQSKGYASDPLYVSKLMDILHRLGTGELQFVVGQPSEEEENEFNTTTRATWKDYLPFILIAIVIYYLYKRFKR